MANVQCEGQCEADVTPPSVSAECEAAVDARAKAEIECKPPSVDLQYQFAASVDADAQASFKVKMRAVATGYANMLAAVAKADYVGQAAGNLVTSAGGAVQGVVDGVVTGGFDLKATVGAGCALNELDQVGAAIGGLAGDLQVSVDAVTSVGGMLGA